MNVTKISIYILFKNVVLLLDRGSTEKSRTSTRSFIISPCLLSLPYDVLYLTVLLSLTGTWTSFPFPRMQAQTSYLRRVLTTLTQKWSPRGLQLYWPEPKLSPCSSTQPTEPTPGTRYSPPPFFYFYMQDVDELENWHIFQKHISTLNVLVFCVTII